MIEAYKKFWKGYVDFTGRSTPSDYWFAYLAHVLIFFAYYLLDAVFERMVSATGSMRCIYYFSYFTTHLFCLWYCYSFTWPCYNCSSFA